MQLAHVVPIVSLCLAIVASFQNSHYAGAQEDDTAQQHSWLDVEHSWPTGMTAHICMDHTLTITCGWKLEVIFSDPITNMEIWDARILSKEPYNGGTKVILRHKHWTKEAKNGTCYRFNAHFTSVQPKVTASYTRVCVDGESKNVPSPPDSTPDQSSRLELENTWPGGMTAEICMDHQLTIDCGWEMDIVFSRRLLEFEIWDAVVKSKVPFKRGTKITLRNVEWTRQEPTGACHRFNARYRGKRPAVTAQYTRICVGGKWTDLSSDGVTQTPPIFTEPGPEDYELIIESSWSRGMSGEMCLFHTSPITCGFDAEIIVSPPVKRFMIWSMAIVDEIQAQDSTRYRLKHLQHTQAQPDNPTCHRFLINHREGEKPNSITGHYTRSCHNGEDNNDPNQGGTVPPPPTTTTETATATTTIVPTTTTSTTIATAPPTAPPAITTTSSTTMSTTDDVVSSTKTSMETSQSTAIPPTEIETTTFTATTSPTTDQQQQSTTTGRQETSSTSIPATEAATRRQTSPETTARQSTQTPSGTTVPPYIPSEPLYNYGEALNKSMQFYFAQRSGPIPDTLVPWRTAASGMTDGNDVARDLTGGWYDAGDYVKFGFPMAASATTLLWGMVEYEQAYRATGELDMMYKLIRHPLEYFLKCWDNENQIFYGQVGNGGDDHGQWGRPEDISIPRPTYQLDKDHGGTELAAETAAALSAGYLVFKAEDPDFADRMLTASRQLYQFADEHRETYTKSIPDAANYYNSFSGYQDELCWGAAWLYAATGEASYQAQAKTAMGSMGQNPQEFSWDSKEIGCYTLMLKIGDEQDKSLYTGKVTNFMQRWTDFNNGIIKTPCELAWLREWGALRYSANTALIALMAADLGVNPVEYRAWAEKQTKYMLGANTKGISYLIGYGTQFPNNPHHRAASCPAAPAPCGWNEFNSPAPNPHQLTGALVGGPDKHDNYEDKRSDYTKNEVTTDYNAGFQSVLAGLINLDLDGQLPKAATKC